MKKTFLSLSILAVIALSSCEKESIKSTKTSSKTQTSTSFEKSNGEPTANSTWFDNGGSVEGICFGFNGNPQNCTTGGVVTASIGGLVTDFGTSSNPGVFAQENYADLKTVIDEDLLDNVISGDNQVSFKGTISPSSHGYLIFKDSSTTKFVYQFGR